MNFLLFTKSVFSVTVFLIGQQCQQTVLGLKPFSLVLTNRNVRVMRSDILKRIGQCHTVDEILNYKRGRNVLYSHEIIADDGSNNDDRRVIQLIDKMKKSLVENDFSSPFWETIRYEAASISEGDLKAASLMSNFVLSQPTFEEAVIDFVANQLETPLFQATQIRNLFAEISAEQPQMYSIWALDLMASAMRDNSQANAVSVLLFNKGFHSLVTYRIANALWYGGRDGLARYFQSLSSRTFGADIHPACKIGHGCVMSCATGVVIGETAVIGNDCIISHDVTLGGTGKESGDRHPKVFL